MESPPFLFSAYEVWLAYHATDFIAFFVTPPLCYRYRPRRPCRFFRQLLLTGLIVFLSALRQFLFFFFCFFSWEPLRPQSTTSYFSLQSRRFCLMAATHLPEPSKQGATFQNRRSNPRNPCAVGVAGRCELERGATATPFLSPAC